MTPEEQRIAIAAACGVSTKRLTIYGDEAPRYSGDLPDYLNDLDAIHEAENQLPNYSNYLRYLGEVVNACMDETADMEDWWLICHATAAQRAEAYLRASGKWV